MRIDERLSRAGERFLLSKTVETYTNIIAMAVTAAVLVILAAWVFHQIRSFGAVWGI